MKNREMRLRKRSGGMKKITAGDSSGGDGAGGIAGGGGAAHGGGAGGIGGFRGKRRPAEGDRGADAA